MEQITVFDNNYNNKCETSSSKLTSSTIHIKYPFTMSHKMF